jgi:MFS family permease
MKNAFMWKLIYFGITYASVFTGYYVTTSFLNIIYPNDAFIGFAIFYAVAGLGCLVSPYVIEKLPLKLSLFIAILLYLIFIGAVSSYNPIFMLIAYGFAGIGSSLIWLIQGIWTSSFKANISPNNKELNKNVTTVIMINNVSSNLVLNTPKTDNKNTSEKGQSMGIFYAIFSINMILGNVTALIILITNVSLQIMIWCMLGVSSIGLILCLFISSNTIEVPITKTGLFQHILDVILIIKDNFMMIIPVFSQSMGLNITFQILPRMMRNTIGPVAVYNSAVFLAYGVSYALTSLATGKLLEKNWKYVIYPYVILETCSLIGILMLATFNQLSVYWIIIGFVRGITDNAINNTCNVTFSKNIPTDLSFAFYRLIYSFTYILGSLVVGYIPYQYVLLIAFIISITGVITFHLHMYYYTTLPITPSIEQQFNDSSTILI